MENETNNQNNETPKKSNKKLIIILSCVIGGLIVLGVAVDIAVSRIFNTTKEILDNSKEIIDNGKELQNKIIEEGKEKQKEITQKVTAENKTFLNYTDNGLSIKVQGKTSELWPAEDVTLYVNDKKIDEFTLSNNDTFKVEKVGELYILVTSNSFAQLPAEQFFVFDVDGNLVKELPSQQDDEHYITSIGYYCTGEYKDSEIILHCQNGMAYVYCNGDVSSYDYYYKVNGKEVTFDHFDTNYYEKDSNEETCNQIRNNH